jgi:hypothetical protein
MPVYIYLEKEYYPTRAILVLQYSQQKPSIYHLIEVIYRGENQMEEE